MKKIFLTLVLLISMGLANTAQAFSFDWGITGGYNMTKLKLGGDLDRLVKSDNKSGWFVGAKANVGLIMGFGLDGALLYSQQKMYFQEKGDDFCKNDTRRSIEVPINLKYSVGLGSVATVYLATGPQFDFNIGGKRTNFMDWEEDYEDFSTFKRETMTTSWNVGVGAKLLGHLDLGLVYNFGLSKLGEAIYENTTGQQWKNDDTKMNTFKVQLTYYF